MNEMSPPTIGDNLRIKAYDPFRKQLAELKEKNEAAFDYEDPQGNKDARSHVHSLRRVKGDLDRVRKAEKQESLELGRRIDAQAKEIEAEIERLIAVHQAKIDEIEQREKDRVKKHEDAIAAIETYGRAAAEQWLDKPLPSMMANLQAIESRSADDQEEFAPLYARAIETATLQIRDAIAKRERHDAEQAELARLREADEARKREEEAERLRKEGEERARREAEDRERLERERAERQREADRKAAEDRENEQRERAERAEREKAEAEERAANAQREAEEKVRREQEERAAQEAREREEREKNRRHLAGINNAAVKAFVDGGLTEDAAKQAVILIAGKKIPRVHIDY